MYKKGFTLTEVMIVLVVVAILCAMLLPKLFSASPDEEKIKAKKAYNTLSRAMEYLTNSGPYATNSGSLDATYYVADTDDQKQYLCNNLVEVLNIQSADCTVDDIADELTTVTDSNCSSDSNLLCMETTNNSNGKTIANYEALQDNMDANCESFFNGGGEYNIATADGVLWGIQLNDFSATDTIAVSGITSPAFYDLICIDTANGENEDYVFGAGIRKDGKIVVGTKLQAILNDEE